MDRLTGKHYDCGDYYMECSGSCANDDEMCGGCLWLEKIINRLGAYEDTGLEPEEIQRMKEYMEPFTIRDIDRFNEIMQAEKEGRLVVLPCKDDIVYTIRENYFDCTECKHGGSAHYQAKIDSVSCDMDNGVHCPLYVREHKVDGFYVKFDLYGAAVLSSPGEFGYEGLEQFCGIDGKVYYAREEAEAALKKME